MQYKTKPYLYFFRDGNICRQSKDGIVDTIPNVGKLECASHLKKTTSLFELSKEKLAKLIKLASLPKPDRLQALIKLAKEDKFYQGKNLYKYAFGVYIGLASATESIRRDGKGQTCPTQLSKLSKSGRVSYSKHPAKMLAIEFFGHDPITSEEFKQIEMVCRQLRRIPSLNELQAILKPVKIVDSNNVLHIKKDVKQAQKA